MKKNIIICAAIFSFLLFSSSKAYFTYPKNSGGHETLTQEAIKIKKDIHKGDADDGREFDRWINDETSGSFLSGAHDEDSTKTLGGYWQCEPPVGPNGDGNYYQHYFDPDKGKGLGSGSALQRAQDFEGMFLNKLACTPGGIGSLSVSDRNKLYDWIGRAFHLLQDMSCPSHTNNDPHLISPFEDYVQNNWSDIINSKEYQDKVNAGQYQNAACRSMPGISIGSLMLELARKSKNYATDTFLGRLKSGGEGDVYDQELMKNVNDLIPEAIQYTACYLDAIYNYIKEPEKVGIDCDSPPQQVTPAGDHPDDRFDVSDEFYWEKEFKLTDYDLTDLFLRTALKKGRIGVWYKKRFIESFMEGRAKYKDASETEKAKLEADFQAWKKRLEERRDQLENDWKGAPDVALFTNGFYNPSISLMLKIGEPVSFQDVDFDPGIVNDQPVMLVPTGGFYGLKNAEGVKKRLEEYVKNGGTLVLFSQQHGYDWGLLPTPVNPETGESMPVSGYGYQEDQSCAFNSVYIDTYHPILSVFSTSTANIGVDGYLTSYPENSTVLLRRTANGQPAMVIYPYGHGYVVATTLYTDFAFSHSQSNQAEINLVENIISWAKRTAQLPEIKPGETASVSVEVKNYMDVDAASVKLTTLDPNRKVLDEQTISQAIGVGQSAIIPFSYTSTLTSTLGIYHIDYTLLDGQGNIIQPQAETDSGRFVVSKPPQKWTSDKPIWFSVSTSSQEVLFGSPFDYTFHVYNNTDQIRNLTIRSYMGHTGRNHEWQIVANPNSETTVSGTDLFIDSLWFFDTMRAALYDESMKEIGTYQLSFKGFRPSASVSVQPNKALYNKGDLVTINVILKNNGRISWQSDVKFIITDPQNRNHFEDRKTVDLSPAGGGFVATSFSLPDTSATGNYMARIEAWYGDQPVSSASAKFEVAQSQLSVIPKIPSALTAGTNDIPITITNTGKINVSSGVLDVSLQDPDGVVVYSGNHPFTLGAGQNTTVNIPLDISFLKFGTYTLTYSQSDETRQGMPESVTFANNPTAKFTLDKPSYKVRETANLTVDLTDTGKFNLENASVLVSVPDFGYRETKGISLFANQSSQLIFSIPIQNTAWAGQHSVELTFALVSGASLTSNTTLTVPEAVLVVGYSGGTNVTAGDTINLTIENTGGIDTEYASQELMIVDSRGSRLYEGQISGSVLAGEIKTIAGLQIPSQAANGTAYLSLQLKESTAGKTAFFHRSFEITGLSAGLQARTDKAAYLRTESIVGLADLVNGPFGIEGGSLRIGVEKMETGIRGKFHHFLPKKGWANFSYPTGVTVGLDGSVYVVDSWNYRIQKFDQEGNLIADNWGIGGQYSMDSALAAGGDGFIYGIGRAIRKYDLNGNVVGGWELYPSKKAIDESGLAIAVGKDGFLYVAVSHLFECEGEGCNYDYDIHKYDRDGNFRGSWGSKGNGEGQFFALDSIAADAEGSVYVLDRTNNRVQKFDGIGNFILQWGGIGNADGLLNWPSAIAVGPEGFVYVVDTGNQRVQKFSGQGNFLNKWGAQGVEDGNFNSPEGIAIGPDGSVYVTDASNKRIQKFDAEGVFLLKLESSGSGVGEFSGPSGIAVAADGSLYVADSYNRRIQMFSRQGDFIRTWPGRVGPDGQVGEPYSAAVSPDGSVYVSEHRSVYPGGDRILKYDSQGNILFEIGQWGSDPGEFIYVTDIAAGPDGSLYIIDWAPYAINNGRVQKFDPNGNFVWPLYHDFWFPSGLAVGSDGTLYVADPLNHRIQKFDGDGSFLTHWVNEGSGDGQILYPSDVAVGPDGSVFVLDDSNPRVQRFDSQGNFIKKWEIEASGGGGMAVGVDGVVYLSSMSSHEILRMIPEMLFETMFPIKQQANSSQDYSVSTGILNTTGKLYLQATLTNKIGQTISQAAYPFYIYEGNTFLTLQMDKKIYKPGETVTITGQAGNQAPIDAVGLAFSLSSKLGTQTSQVLYTETMNIPAGEVQSFNVTTTAGVEGTVSLIGKVSQNETVLVEVNEQYDVAKPAISVSVTGPDVAESDAFIIGLEIKNRGKIGATVNLGVSSSDFGDSQLITIPAGETRSLQYSQQITRDVTYTFTFTGDLEQTLSKKISYGLSASMVMNSQAVYAEGSVAVPVILTNAGPLAGTMEVSFRLFSPPPSTSPIEGEGSAKGFPIHESKKFYYLPSGGSIADTLYFNLAEGEYQLMATSQVPVLNVQANFSVRKGNKVDMAISTGVQEGGLIPVSVNVTNQGYNSVAGSVQLSAISDQGTTVWAGSQDVYLASSLPPTPNSLSFNVNPAAIPAGSYTIKVDFLSPGGQSMAQSSSPFAVSGPTFQITQVPGSQTFYPGQEASLSFRVKNAGDQEGAAEFHFKAYDLIDLTRSEWLKAGEDRQLPFSFVLPVDLEEKDYFADYEVKGGAKGQVKYHLAGINIGVQASLNKANYQEGDVARLTLSVSTPSSMPSALSLFARVNYPGYESKKSFSLDVSQSLSFDIPLAKITGEKLFYGIYHESGRSIHLNSLYIRKVGDVLTITTDKEVYKPGDTVTVSVSGTTGGTLTLTAPNYDERLTFAGPITRTLTLPGVMTAGTYYVSYQLSTTSGQSYTGSHPFDVAGIQVKVKEAKLDKAKYAASDTITLSLTVESNQDLAATLKTWVVEPDKVYTATGVQGINLTASAPLLADQSFPFTTAKLGIHRLVYGLYSGDLLLCSGSEAFDMGEATILGISTDKADYPQGNESVVVSASLYGTVPATLEFFLDGDSMGSQPVSFASFVTVPYTLPPPTPGRHTLKANLSAGGLSLAKETTFIYGSGLPDLTVRVSSDPNIKDGFMTITVAVTNQGKSASSATTLTLYDGEEFPKTLDVKGLQAGETQTFTYSLNVLGRAGANSLVSRIDPGNQVVEFSKANNESNISFSVPDLSLGLSPDKNIYGLGETIVITSSIYNLSKVQLSGLTLATEVKDASGATVFTKTQALPTLEEAKGSGPIQTLWPTDAGLREGVYSVGQTVQGTMTTRAIASVEVKDFAKGLEGKITAQPNPVKQGSQEALSYTVTNKGGVDLKALIVTVQVVNPETGEVKNTYENVADLGRNATVSGSFSASTAGLTPRVYNGTLQVSSAGILTPKALGSASFEVKPAVPMMSWAKTYGGEHKGVAYSIQQTLDGGYIAAGATGLSSQPGRGAWVWKLGVKGEIQWQKSYGTGRGDAAYAVQPTTDGGYVVAGETDGILGVGRQCWVWKLDVTGEIQWQKTYGEGWARSIQQTFEGGYIVAGTREEHAWVLKLDGKGAIQWQKSYGGHGDAVHSAQQTVDGGYIVAGVAGSEAREGSHAAWVGKLDAKGEIQWQKVYGRGHGDAAHSIQQTTDGGYIIAGVTKSSEKGNHRDAWVWKIDAHGEIEWQKAYGGRHRDAFYSVEQTADDGYIVAGVTKSFGHGDHDAWVLKLDGRGEIEWQKAYGAQHRDAAFAIQQAKDGGYIVAGGTNSFEDHEYDVWVWKVDEKGNTPACREGWMKNTDVLARETQEVARDGHRVRQNTHVLPKESHAQAREMQGWARDVCAGVPDISVDPTSRFINFSGVKVGKSSTKTITVSNRGTGDLEIESIKISGASLDASQFSQKNDCTILSPGHSCAIAVSFKPTVRGPRNIRIEILSNDPDDRLLLFNLSGEGK